MIHIYSGILLSHKREEIGSFVEMWMDLGSVTQSEVRQKEKYRIIKAYMRNLEKWCR